MRKIYFGSADSFDTDIFYVLEELPKTQEERKILSKSFEGENVNLITVEDGVVSSCFKGTVDENNNCILDTYDLHKQEYPNPIERRLPRNIRAKEERVVIAVLCRLSRTNKRSLIKPTLKKTFKERLEVLKEIKFEELTGIEKKKETLKDQLKNIAFQLAQGRGLQEGIEIFTKQKAVETYPELKSFIYREDERDLRKLTIFKDNFVRGVNWID